VWTGANAKFSGIQDLLVLNFPSETRAVKTEQLAGELFISESLLVYAVSPWAVPVAHWIHAPPGSLDVWYSGSTLHDSFQDWNCNCAVQILECHTSDKHGRGMNYPKRTGNIVHIHIYHQEVQDTKGTRQNSLRYQHGTQYLAMETFKLVYNTLPSSSPTHTASFSSPDVQPWHSGSHQQMLTQWNSDITEMAMYYSTCWYTHPLTSSHYCTDEQHNNALLYMLRSAMYTSTH